MSIIHMQTESVYDLVSRLNQYSAHIANISDDLRNASFRLDVHWTGGKGDYYGSRLRNSARRMNDLNSQIQALRIRTGNEVEEWEQTAANLHDPWYNGVIQGIQHAFDDVWQKSTTLPFISGLPGNGEYLFDHVLAGAALITGLAANQFSKRPITSFTNLGEWVGRQINRLPNVTGYVGTMGGFTHDIGEFVKKANAEAVFGGVGGFVFDFIDGARDGEGLLQNSATALFTGAAIYAGTRFIPGVGTILLVSDAVQFAGTGLAFGLNLFGLENEANIVNNITESLDLQGYVGDLADGIYKLATPPYPPTLEENLGDSFSDVYDRANGGLDVVGDMIRGEPAI